MVKEWLLRQVVDRGWNQMIEEQQLSSSNQFNVHKITPGVYIVRVQADGHEQEARRIVVER